MNECFPLYATLHKIKYKLELLKWFKFFFFCTFTYNFIFTTFIFLSYLIQILLILSFFHQDMATSISSNDLCASSTYQYDLVNMNQIW